MKKYYFLIIVVLILGLVLAGCVLFNPVTPSINLEKGNPITGNEVCIDLVYLGLSPGNSIEGAGTLLPYLTISSSGDVVVLEDGNSISVTYGAPNDPAHPENPSRKNGCIGTLISEYGFGDLSRNHDYTFTFTSGVTVDSFSLRMLDFGDYFKYGGNTHTIKMTAYDADNTIVDFNQLTVSGLRDLVKGDACTADSQLNEPGNYVFEVTGSGIVRVEIQPVISIDPNIGFNDLCFTIEEYTLTVNTVGSGSVTLVPPGGTYLSGSEVELTAVPAAGWSFSGWSDDLSSSTNPESIIMDSDKTVTATFTEDCYTLAVTIEGSGSVDKALNEICYTYDTVVTLTPTGDPGWNFDGWSGPDSNDISATAPYTITMNEDKEVTAIFSQWEVPVDIKPTSCPNPLNTKSQGVTPVAILGTADFDVALIDPATVKLEGIEPLRWDWEDVATPFEPYTGKENCDFDCHTEGPDGFLDLTLKFDTQELLNIFRVESFEVSEEELNALEGGVIDQVTTTNGEPLYDGACLVISLVGRQLDEGKWFVGEDVVRILEKGKK